MDNIMKNYGALLVLCVTTYLVKAQHGFNDYVQSSNDVNTDIPSVEGVDIVTWCTTSILEQEKCEKLMWKSMEDMGLFERDFIQLKCKRAFDVEQCMQWVDRGEASLLGLDAGEVFVAGRLYSLVPILQEVYSDGRPFQYSVAVVRKGALGRVRAGALHELRGARACFPGVGALAGWVMPVHVLMQEGGLKITDCNNHVKSATEYFGDSCAPNSLKNMYNPIGDNSDKMCRLCAGGAGVRCSLADPHAGYAGALRCLAARGDVAFVRDTAVQHALRPRQADGLNADEFELLCRDGSRAPLGSWLQCHWGLVPADAVVTSSAADHRQRRRYQKYFQRLIQLYGEPNPLNSREYNQTTGTQGGRHAAYGGYSTEQARFGYEPYRRYNQQEENQEADNRISTMSPYSPRPDMAGANIESNFYLFRSNGTTDLLVQDSTTNFRILKEEEQVAGHILNNPLVGEQASRAVSGVRDCPVRRAVLCVTSEAELHKCVKMRTALRSAYLSPLLVCHRTHSGRQCARCVADGACDLTALDAADMVLAAYQHRLVPFMQEIYSSGENFYYAVAVAKEQDPDTDLTYLRGKRTCHTGIGMAAGWVYPLAYLLSNGWMRSYGCDGARAAAEYFSKSCVPGALSSEYVDAGSVPRDNLCHLCHGPAYRRCRRDASEDYFGSLGALRCMVEGGGDAALVAHHAPAAATAGTRPEWWARDLLPDDLQLLCPDGTRAKPHEYLRCNLGRVAGSVLVGRANHTELDAFANLMVYAQQLYGAAATDDFSFSMFSSPPPYSDLIFSDAAVMLRTLPYNQRSADKVGGLSLLRAMRLVSCAAPGRAADAAADARFLAAPPAPAAAAAPAAHARHAASQVTLAAVAALAAAAANLR